MQVQVLLCPPFIRGEVAERLIAAVLKTAVGKTTGGSNPSFTAINLTVYGVMTLIEVKQRYKDDFEFIEQNKVKFFLNFIRQKKEFRHWEYMWIKVIIGLFKLYFLALMYRFKFWIVCVLNGYFPWEIK